MISLLQIKTPLIPTPQKKLRVWLWRASLVAIVVLALTSCYFAASLELANQRVEELEEQL